MITLIFALLFGACLGSFLHVVITNFNPEKSLITYLYNIGFRRSICPVCGKKLTVFELIPIASWCWQKGRCKGCRVIIPIHYLVCEITSAICAMVLVLWFGFSVTSLLLMLLATVFVALAVIDIQYYLLPDIFILFIMLTGLLSAYLGVNSISFDTALAGCIIGYLLLWLPSIGYYLLRKRHGLGGGDIKLLSALGAWIEFTYLPLLLVVACMIGIIIFMVVFWINRKMPTMIPFGPCLLVAGYMLLLFQCNYS